MWSASSSTVTDDLGEVEAALLDEVLDAAGRADDDVDAALERTDLTVLRHAAVDLRGEEADALRDGLHGAVDLQGELAGRGEDERAGLAAHLALAARLPDRPRRQTLDERRAEGDGLAGAGLAAAEHVLPASTTGMVAAWIGNGDSAPSSCEHAHDVAAEARGRRRVPSTSSAWMASASRRSSTTSSCSPGRGAAGALFQSERFAVRRRSRDAGRSSRNGPDGRCTNGRGGRRSNAAGGCRTNEPDGRGTNARDARRSNAAGGCRTNGPDGHRSNAAGGCRTNARDGRRRTRRAGAEARAGRSSRDGRTGRS